MKKNIIKAFALVCALAFAISCNNKGTTGPGGSTGGGSTGGGKFPAWYLTAEQQQQDYIQPEQIVFRTSSQKKYRIPSIIVADNGDIIAFADDRKKHGSDIGLTSNPIDIVYRISKDGGKTWLPEKTLLPISKPGLDANNKGDPIAFKALNGDIIVLAIGGGAYFNAPKNPSILLMTKSTDNGQTWTGWKEVGKDIWTKKPFGSSEFAKANKGFVASGRGLTLIGKGGNRRGRLMAAMLVEKNSGGDGIVSIYSDDNGETWHAGGIVKNGGSGVNINEPKVIAELNDGTIVMSIRNPQGRNTGHQPRLHALSKDGGLNWNDANGSPDVASAWNDMGDSDVNAEGVVWTREGEQDKNRIIHVVSDGTSGRRRGLGLYLSEDEAKTFMQIKKIEQDNLYCCYSCIDVLPDGTVIIFYERLAQSGSGEDLVFKRFNMKYLTGEVYSTDWYKAVKN